MQKIIIVFLAFVLLSCSNDSESEAFAISVSTPTTTAELFENVLLTVDANRAFTVLEIRENYMIDPYGHSVTTAFQGGTSTCENYITFDKIGQKVLTIKATDAEGNVAQQTVTYNVIRGDKVRITSVKLTSFPNSNTTMDPEFEETDSNRLADLTFGLSCNCPDWLSANLDSGQNNFNRWLYRSPVRMNEADLIWDLSAEEVYADPQIDLRFSLSDIDGNDQQAYFFTGSGFTSEYLNIDFSTYSNSRPSTIIIHEPTENIEIEFGVEWPN